MKNELKGYEFSHSTRSVFILSSWPITGAQHNSSTTVEVDVPLFLVCQHVCLGTAIAFMCKFVTSHCANLLDNVKMSLTTIISSLHDCHNI